METKLVQLEIPKEMDDIRVFLVAVVADIKAKKQAMEIVSGNLQKLIDAVAGFEKLGEEAKSDQAYNCYGLLVSDLIKVLK
jgi:hypothetical protein